MTVKIEMNAFHEGILRLLAAEIQEWNLEEVLTKTEALRQRLGLDSAQLHAAICGPFEVVVVIAGAVADRDAVLDMKEAAETSKRADAIADVDDAIASLQANAAYNDLIKEWMEDLDTLNSEFAGFDDELGDVGTEDTGRHYRYSLRVAITTADAAKGFVKVNLDPYRIADIYNLGGGPREHLVKKGLRGTSKGGTERQLVKELRDAIDRWEEILDENDRWEGLLDKSNRYPHSAKAKLEGVS